MLQVDVLPPEADSSISMLQPDEKPDISYADIGGMDMQKQEVSFLFVDRQQVYSDLLPWYFAECI